MLTHRLAAAADLPALRTVMDRAIAELQRGSLSPAQIAASRAVLGLDTQLVADGTYFPAEAAGRIDGCGGWSRRATLYGGAHSTGLREPAHLQPTTYAEHIRARSIHPNLAHHRAHKPRIKHVAKG